MISPLQGYEQQNGPETKYYLEPFCGLRKPYDYWCAREDLNLHALAGTST
jgi:hypothetical protein